MNANGYVLGWRSQDSLINNEDPQRFGSSSKYLTPNERLAYSYRHGGRSASSHSGIIGTNTGNNRYGLVHQQRAALNRNYASEQLVHDSIKSVSSAIMEFCTAPDVPDVIRTPPTRHRMRSGGTGAKEPHRAQIVWLESSFVSAIPETKSKL